MTGEGAVIDLTVCVMKVFPGAVKKLTRHGVSPTLRCKALMQRMPSTRKQCVYVLQFGTWRIDRRAMWF